MSSFRPLNDKGDNFLNQRQPVDDDRHQSPTNSTPNESGKGEDTKAPAVHLSISPITDAKKVYQDQIEQWLRKPPANGKSSGYNRVVSPGKDDADNDDITAVPPPEQSSASSPKRPGSRRNSICSDGKGSPIGRERRGSMSGSEAGSPLGKGRRRSRTGSDVGSPLGMGRRGSRRGSEVKIDIGALNGDFSKSTFLGKALGGVQNMLNFGTMKPSSSFRAKAISHSRVRGTQLTKNLREVAKQRELVPTKEEDPALWKRPIWDIGGEHEQEKRSFQFVEQTVAKAREYSGPNNLKNFQDEEQMGTLYWLHMTAPYLKVAGFVILATMDLVMALIFHVFWARTDFMCSYENLGPDRPVLVLLATVAFLHFARTVSKLAKTDSGGERIGLRFFYSKELFGYFGLWVNNADFFLNASSATVLALHAMDCGPPEGETDLYHIIIRRIHGHFHLIRSLFAFQRCFSMNEYLRQQLQIAVSVNKRRFTCPESKINLDLTYIADRLIAMAIPCVDYVMYRNDIRDVARFFAQFHYGTFLVYNLCENHEEGGNGNYDTSLLYHQVQRISFYDHNVPRFRCIVKFCETASTWLCADDKNVVAVHCQGGKGRTGTFCSALMLWTGLCDTAQEALDKFALRRTQRMRFGESLQGVASPSQIRYVHYLEAYIYEAVDYQVYNYILLTHVSFENMKPACMKGYCLTFVVEVDGCVHYDHGKEHGFLTWEQCEQSRFKFDLAEVIVAGDVTVRFFLVDEFEALTLAANNAKANRGCLGPGAKTIKYGTLAGKEMLFCSFHTAFHAGDITFLKNEIDGAYHACEEKYDEDFSMTMHFRHYTGQEKDDSPELYKPRPSVRGMAAPQLKGLEEFMPKKINSAMQFLETNAAVAALFERICPSPLSFSAGEAIMQQSRNGYISMHYIIKGNTTTQPPSSVVTMQSIKSVFDGEMHGVGDVLHRGMDKMSKGTCQTYYVGGPMIQTRVIELPLTKEGYLPIESPTFDQTDLSHLYSFLAHQVASRSRKYRDKISQLNSTNATKRASRLLESSNDKKVLEKLASRFGIPKTEGFFCGAVVERERHNGSFEIGQAYVVSNWVLFEGKKPFLSTTTARELVIRIKDILSSEAKGEMVEIRMASDRDLGEPAGRTHSHAGVFSSHRRSSVASLADELGTLTPKLGGEKGWRTYPPFSWLFSQKGNPQQTAMEKHGQVGLMQKRFVGTMASLRFQDEESSEAFSSAINARMRELQSHDNRQLSWDMSALKFGYILPEERDDEDGRDFLQHLLNISEVRTYAAGEEIIHHSDAFRSLYHVISGTALRYSNSNNHMEDIGPGELVGEWRFLAYNSGFAETSHVVASTEVKCFVSPFEQVQTLCSLRKEFAVRFYRGLALSCIIRARQFRRLYQQNLQSNREKDDVERVSLKRNHGNLSLGHSRHHPNRVSISSNGGGVRGSVTMNMMSSISSSLGNGGGSPRPAHSPGAGSKHSARNSQSLWPPPRNSSRKDSTPPTASRTAAISSDSPRHQLEEPPHQPAGVSSGHGPQSLPRSSQRVPR